MTKELLESCKDFNRMYKLPVSEKPSIRDLGEDWRERLKNFKKTLLDEVYEIDDIIEAPYETTELETLTSLSDLLGDLAVYIHSEATKFGIPLDGVLKIIMDSNASKLGADGKPIYNEEGKVLKGPDYWKPEPQIQNLLFNTMLPKVLAPIEVDPAAKYLSQETAS